MTLVGVSGGSNNAPPPIEEKLEIILSISEALRLLPTDETGQNRRPVVKIRGMITSVRPVIKMVSGEYAKCPVCGWSGYERYDKPLFEEKGAYLPWCQQDSNLHPVMHDPKTDEIMYDKQGNMRYEKPFLDTWFEYRNASIVELQDIDKFDDLERLQVILFDDDTRDIRAGEQVLVTGAIEIEKFAKMDFSLHSRLYSHSIVYEARREVSLSSQDVDAVKQFVSRFGNGTVDKLSRMLAPDVIGLYNVKKALIMSAASCGNDVKKPRKRINSLLVGEPGLAKTLLLKRTCEIVPNGRTESAQNSSGKSLTAIVTKENGENTVLRLGAIPFAKESICGLNELGRMSFDDQAPLLDILEEGEFTINKYGLNARIRSPTVVVGSANPTGSKWSIGATDDSRINLNDIPAIKPLIDRFDYVLIIKMPRDKEASREYAEAKSRYENSPVPNYNAYLEKHLIYAKRFNPKVSETAMHILNEFYTGVVINMGSPRVRDTLYRTAKMVAGLKLKKVVDANDAIETCQFFNAVQMEYNRIIYVPPDPEETACKEYVYTLEITGTPMTLEEITIKTCSRNENVQTFIGHNYRSDGNKKIRRIVKRILEDSRIQQVGYRPIVLQYIKSTDTKDSIAMKESSSNINQPTDLADLADLADLSDRPLHTHKDEKQAENTDNRGKDDRSDRADRADRADRSSTVMEQSSKPTSNSVTGPAG